MRFLSAAVKLLVLGSGVILAGCGRPPADEPNAKIVIEFWHQPMVSVVPGKESFTKEPGDFERYLAEQFMRDHPGVIVRTQCLNWEDLPRKVPISVLGGSQPDVLQDFLGRTSGYWYQGVLEPLDDVVAPVRDDFYEEMLEEYTIDGRLHAVPLSRWVQAMAINRTIWEKSGQADLLPTPEHPRWSYEQFEKALEAVAVPNQLFPLGLQVASEQGDYSVLQFFWGMGAEIYANRDYDQVTLNSPAGVRALSWLVEARQKGWIQPNVTTIGVSELFDMLWRGNIACLISGPGLLRTYENALREGRVTTGVDLMFTLPPTAAGVEPSLPFGSSGLAVFKQSDPLKRKAVMEFVRFLSRTEVIRDYCRAAYQLPSRKSVGNIFTGQPALALLQEQAEKCRRADMGLTSPHYYDIRKRLPPQLQFAFLGRKSPAEALADFQRSADQVLRR